MANLAWISMVFMEEAARLDSWASMVAVAVVWGVVSCGSM